VFGAAGLHGHESWAAEGIAGFVLLSFLAGWLPMKLALRQLKDFEA